MGAATTMTNDEFLVFRDRRKLLAYLPDSYTRYHRGPELRVQEPGDNSPRYSFLGQALALALAGGPGHRSDWREQASADGRRVWNCDDHLDTLSAYYRIPADELRRIAELQADPDCPRWKLAERLQDAPYLP